jgi:hypothetical protein
MAFYESKAELCLLKERLFSNYAATCVGEFVRNTCADRQQLAYRVCVALKQTVRGNMSLAHWIGLLCALLHLAAVPGIDFTAAVGDFMHQLPSTFFSDVPHDHAIDSVFELANSVPEPSPLISAAGRRRRRRSDTAAYPWRDVFIESDEVLNIYDAVHVLNVDFHLTLAGGITCQWIPSTESSLPYFKFHDLDAEPHPNKRTARETSN